MGAEDRDGVILFCAISLVNFINLIFQMVVVRKLNPGDYGALGALTGALVIFTIPAFAMQVVITREVASRGRKSGETAPVEARQLLTEAVIWGTGTAVVFLALSPLVKDFLHLPKLSPALLLAAYVIPIAIDLVPRAVLLGEERFIRVSFALVLGATARLVAGWLLTEHFGLPGAMGANVIGAAVAAAVLVPGLQPFTKRTEGVDVVHVRFSDAARALFAFSGYAVFLGIQPFLARHLLPAEESGFYVAANTVASIALFLPAAIGLVAFPKFARAGRGPAVRSALFKASAITGLLCFGSALALALAPGLISRNLFGSHYDLSGAGVGFLAFSAACTGIVYLLMQFHLATRGSMAASLCWIGVAIYAVGVWFFHDSITQIGVVSLASVLVVLLLSSSIAFAKDPGNPLTTSTEVWEHEEPTLDLTVVIPFFNAGNLLRANIERVIGLLDNTPNLSYEIIAVSDGSTDGAEKTLEGLDSEHLRTIVLPVNQGKGQALRVGLTLGKGRYLGFIDADGDIHQSALEAFIALMKLYDPDIILGSKRHPLSSVKYPPIRKVYSWGYQQLIHLLFNLRIRDTQTGLKLIRRDVLVEVLPRMVEKRFAFDLELFVVARHLGFERYFEAPIKIEHQFTSTVNVSSVRGTLQDTLAIFYRLHFLRYYDEPRRVGEQLDPAAPPPRSPSF